MLLRYIRGEAAIKIEVIRYQPDLDWKEDTERALHLFKAKVPSGM
jgi:hypothetical protein